MTIIRQGGALCVFYLDRVQGGKVENSHPFAHNTYSVNTSSYLYSSKNISLTGKQSSTATTMR